MLSDTKRYSYIERLSTLAEVDLIAIDGTDHLTETLTRIVNIGNDLVPSDLGVHIILWNAETEKFSLSATSLKTLSPDDFSNDTREKGGVTRHIIDSQKKMIIDDVNTDPFRYGRLMKDHGVISYIGIPMVSGEKSVGVLFVFNGEARKYSSDDIILCELLAKRAAIAVEKADQFLSLEYKATRDGLTKLLNKATFSEIAKKICEESARHGKDLSLVFLDIDGFKQINDTYGHTMGDKILQKIADQIISSIREMDVAARYGGDEFIILFPDTSAVQLAKIVNRIKSNLSKVNWGLMGHDVIVSLGWAEAHSPCSLERLIEIADTNMYYKKRTRKLGN